MGPKLPIWQGIWLLGLSDCALEIQYGKVQSLVLHFDLSVVQEKVLVYSCPDYHYYPRKSVLLNNAKAKQSKYHVEAIIIQIGF